MTDLIKKLQQATNETLEQILERKRKIQKSVDELLETKCFQAASNGQYYLDVQKQVFERKLVNTVNSELITFDQVMEFAKKYQFRVIHDKEKDQETFVLSWKPEEE